MKSNNVILIGFMGTGKSTVGRLLAPKLGYSFTDTDHRIEQEQGRSIPIIFERYGEAHFRKLEKEALENALEEGNKVIATGGGAVLAEANRKAMLDGGYVVALKADKATIMARVSRDEDRPLLRGDLEERVTTLLESRKTAYDFAHLIVDTSGLSPYEVVEYIVSKRKVTGC